MANMNDFQSYLWGEDDDVIEMVPYDFDPFFIKSRGVFNSFETALGDNPQAPMGTSHLYQSAMIEYGDAMKAKINKCKQNGTQNTYRVFLAIAKDILTDANMSWKSVIQVIILGCVLANQNKEDDRFCKRTLAYIVGKVLQDHEEWIVLNAGYQSLIDKLSYLVRLQRRQARRRSARIKLALVGGMAAVGAYATYKTIRYFFW